MSAATEKAEPGPSPACARSQRLDKWLWFARIVKTRSLATRLVSAGKVRINRVKCAKPSQPLRCGDVVTAVIGRNIRVLKVLGAGRRRGPASEAQQLYEDLAPSPAPGRAAAGKPQIGADLMAAGQRLPGAGRPTKRERRQLDRLLGASKPGDA